MWTYTLPSERSVEILNEAGYPLFTGALGCARTMRALADYRALRERTLTAAGARRAPRTPARDKVRARARCRRARCSSEWQARPLLAAYGIGDDDGAVWRSRRPRPKPPPRRSAGRSR